MKKYLLIGIIILIVDFIALVWLQDINFIPKITGITGGLFLVLAIIMTGGIFNDPDSRRLDLAVESRESLKRRVTWSTRFLLISAPSMFVCILSFILLFW
ncbi:DUF5316 family protein [Bacillus gobiensis]|uniref:DUF5316 family protein n=1 Tax=Bacillus gobiensis TaxID=1441095 RepID=UPI003D202686